MAFRGRPAIKVALAVATALAVAACAAVDQFGSRIYDGNSNSNFAQNQETLVNIVRASRLQPLNFVAISQVAGGQSESLNTGLPTMTFGPAQTAAQHLFQITNSVQSGVTGSYQSAPLVSTAFSTGMLSPIDPKITAFLVNAYPREPVFVSTIESIVVKRLRTGETVRYVNDPTRDDPTIPCNDLIANATGKRIAFANRCSFSLFINTLGLLTNAGLTAELVKSASAPKAGAKAGAKKGAKDEKKSGGSSGDDSKKEEASGRLCFDPTRALRTGYMPVCGALPSNEKLTFAFNDLGKVDITLVFRSPVAVFNFYGRLLNAQPPTWRGFYFTNQARDLVGLEPFLNIVQDRPLGCFASISFAGRFYCVPEESRHTALLMTLLLHLRNLNIQPSDLNAPFTVRLSN